MIRQCELVEHVRRYRPEVNETLLNKAYIYAMQRHQNQKRASGDPYFSHPLEVAAILADMHMDEATIAVALLHDTIEDTTATREEIDELFGPDLGKLVEGLTKLDRLDLVSSEVQQAENLRKFLLAVCDDVRVLLVKFADRLHNMRTLDHIPENKRTRIAKETMEIYAPLAGRMGMQSMREEFEDLAFRFIHPEAWQTMTERLVELTGQNKDIVENIEKILSELLVKNGLNANVKGRVKKSWSVFRKMQDKGLSFEQLSDIFGFRIIADTLPDCYRALGCVHTTWSMVPGRFKDYISIPKQNGYQSIHTTIIGPFGKRIELQIRTAEMNRIAEYGISAHAFYKCPDARTEKSLKPESAGNANVYAWLHETIHHLSEGENPEDFLENTKLELFQDQVFCFTPKGKLIALPCNATPIDFAYAVHTDIGNTCTGAKVNGRMMPLMVKLKNGDEIEILCLKSETPRASWEKIVVTGKARAAIRKATRVSAARQYSGLGEKILEKAFERESYPWNVGLLEPVLHVLGRKDKDDVLTAVGRGELTPKNVLKAVIPENWKKQKNLKLSFRRKEDGWFNLYNAAGMLFRIPAWKKRLKGFGSSSAMPIRGVQSDLPVRFCTGGAIPGDRIVGILQQGSGITIYPIQSPFLREFDEQPECWIDVQWDADENLKERFPAQISIIVTNVPRSLPKIADTIGRHDVNIHAVSTHHSAHDFTEIIFDLELWNLKNLENLLAELKTMPNISQAKRTAR